MSFLDELQKGTNKTRTANGAVTNKSTLNSLLDFFSMAGAMRKTPDEALKLFQRAYVEDPQGAVRALFYLRDVRGGQGERKLFRTIMAEVIRQQPETFDKIAHHIPEYGRWDDLLHLYSARNNSLTEAMIKRQLEVDEASMEKLESVSLLAKWLPSENATSKESKKLAKQLAKALGMTPAQYRRRVVKLRQYIKLLEQKMSTNQWAEIDYSKLPSQAHRKHVKAFKRHDEARYTEFIGKATKGEAKLNSGALFTYEIFDEVAKGNTDAASAMWANLPDWTNGENALVVADVSGSMSGRPMSVSVSLALYFAERNSGIFRDYFMTFSEQPHLTKVIGTTLADKLRFIESREWGMSTNLESVFGLLLEAGKASPDDMPKVVYIISDMQFNQAIARPNESIFDNAKAAFAAEGLELPHVVFWNVNAFTGAQSPATKFDNRVTLISGLSQSTFQYVVAGKTPEKSMYDVLNSERYAPIKL